MKATDTLRTEHLAVSLMLEIMEAISVRITAGQSVQRQDLDNMIDFLSVFVDQCHHAKEEQILFPELELAGIAKNGGPIGVMLAEHDLAREYIRIVKKELLNYGSADPSQLTDLTGSMQAYIELLNEHTHKENEILFEMADKLLSEEVQDRLYYQFEELEEEVIGLGKHEELHKILEKMSAVYLT
ncbi:MAG: hemerythrin domain-containing protein [Synergistota bacterium]|nr:hemerythrin domain-containing protein [Synergistota bacterium]